MWIAKELIPVLIHAIEQLITEQEAYYASGDADDDLYDPNDVIILDSFVLHSLRASLDYGLYSSEMLHKGFRLMMGMVPGYLAEHHHTLSDEVFAALADLHYEYSIKEALSYLKMIDPKHLRENLDRVNAYIESAKLELVSHVEAIES